MPSALVAARRTCARFAGTALLIGALATSAVAQDWELLPDAALHLEGARYVPSETELAWTTWLGAGVGLVRLRDGTAYLGGDVETIFGNARRVFDADQVNYQLEGGVRIGAARWLVVPFFHHVSRHLIDRPKVPNEDWNMLGVRAARTSTLGDRTRVRYELGVGRNVKSHFVDYEWELTARSDAELRRFARGSVFARAAARLVTTGAELQRDGFVDVTVEGGLRFSRGERRLDLFAAYEHRNDVLLLTPGARDRALLGLRFVSSPPDYLDPVWP